MNLLFRKKCYSAIAKVNNAVMAEPVLTLEFVMLGHPIPAAGDVIRAYRASGIFIALHYFPTFVHPFCYHDFLPLIKN